MLTPFEPLLYFYMRLMKVFCMTHSKRMCVCIYAKLSKPTPVEPHGQDVSSLTYTHLSYADRSPCALTPSLSGGVQRGPGRPQRSALAIWSTLGLEGYWIPLPWPAGWVARPSAALFSSPAWLIGGLTHWLPLQSPHTVTRTHTLLQALAPKLWHVYTKLWHTDAWGDRHEQTRYNGWYCIKFYTTWLHTSTS